MLKLSNLNFFKRNSEKIKDDDKVNTFKLNSNLISFNIRLTSLTYTHTT